jgi:alpha-L-arabinofuranosidase
MKTLLCTLLLAAGAALAAGPAVRVSVRADTPGAHIEPAIYGQFAEHLGRLIYEGIWVGEDSAIPNTRGYRNDVIAALKELGVPVLRWPGGCFADEYNWRDGIGPRGQRPRKVNTHWGGVVEDNSFGTHEFMDFAELIGAETYVNGNVGTGTPREMAEWLEYMTADGDSSLAQLRRRNGRDKPWRVHYFAVGNETWGCGGNMRAEYYADLYRHYVTFLKSPETNKPLRIASGGTGSRLQWTEVLMREAASQMDAISVHYYTLPTGKWDKKGAATKFTAQEWWDTLGRTYRMEWIVTEHSKVMDKYDDKKRVGLYVDEWGTWYDVEPGTNPGFLYQQNTLRDALVAAINLNIFHAHADRVRMTNIAQMVNVLQAMILTEKEKMVLTPTYHVFHMYKPFRGATQLPVSVDAATRKVGDQEYPTFTASAARDANGRLVVALVNLDPGEAVTTELAISGARVERVTGRVLTAGAMDAHNTFSQPQAVKPARFDGVRLGRLPVSGADATKTGTTIRLTTPAKAIVVLTEDVR